MNQRTRLRCALGLHRWEGSTSPGPDDARRWCTACGKCQIGAYDGVAPYWRTSHQPPAERVCVGVGSSAQMMLRAREITRAPVLGVGVVLTDNDHPMAMERGSDDRWRLMVWVDRRTDYREHRRLKNLYAGSAD